MKIEGVESNHLCVCYHYLYCESHVFMRKGITCEVFEKQIKVLKKNYDIIGFHELKDLKNSSRVCLITFDDGVSSCYSSAFPILEKLRVPATFFICSQVYKEKKMLLVHKCHALSSYLGTGEFRELFYKELVQYKEMSKIDHSRLYKGIYPYDNGNIRQFKLDLNYRLPYKVVNRIADVLMRKYVGVNPNELTEEFYMKFKELQCVSRSKYIRLGAHTHSHRMLSRLSEKEQNNEVCASVDFLVEHRLCRDHIAFAYPFGREETYTPVTEKILRKDQRIKWVCTVERGKKWEENDIYIIHRHDVNDLFISEK